MRQFKNNLKRNRGRNHSDRSFKRSQDIDKLNGNFANNDNSFRRKINRNNTKTKGKTPFLYFLYFFDLKKISSPET